MALNLTIKEKYKYDGSEINIVDATQTCNEEAAGLWSAAGNPARADRCLISWTKYTDDTGSETYLKYDDQYIGTFEELSFAPGAALADTDQSVFTVISTKDGQHTFYALAIEQYASAPGAPSEGDVYYNTATVGIYLYTTAWTEITTVEQFASLESNTTKAECDVLVPTRLLIKKADLTHTWEECLLESNCDSDSKFYDLQYLRSRLEGAQGAFYGGMKPTGRKTIKQLSDKFC